MPGQMILRSAPLWIGVPLLCGLADALPGQAEPPTSPPPAKPRPAGEKQAGTKPKPPAFAPPVLDALAKKTLEKWRALELHPGRAGLESIECEVVARSRGGMTGTWKATGTYRFGAGSTAPGGTLTWRDDAKHEVADALKRRGWTAEAFSRSYEKAPLLRRLRGATVKGNARKNGTILAIVGGDRKEDRFWLFNNDGVRVGAVVGPLRQKFQHETKVLDKKTRYIRTGSSYTVEEAAGEVTIWNREVKGFLLPVKIREVVRVKGQILSDLTFLFRKHRVNGPKAEPPTSRPAKASAPAKKSTTDTKSKSGNPKKDQQNP